ncbi:hypothetical protein MKX08_003333 [Trichoderma sp. CBMAI-0020]|nr:hypothetical protein MKX08_003333 [Trichoderma sp. CBMAI-0020]
MATLAEQEPDDTEDIYDNAIECTALFKLLLKDRAKLGYGKKDTRDGNWECKDEKMALEYRSSSSKRGTDEMRKSFNLWIDYTGALSANVNISLDTRLNAHGDIKEMIGDTVKTMPPSSNGGDEYNLEDEARDTIQKALDQLHFMATAIRRSSVRGPKYHLSSDLRRDDDRYFQEHACLLVRYYFTDARRSLCDQLGASVAMRRRKIFQRMRHEKKLSTKRSPKEPDDSPNPVKGTVVRPQQLKSLGVERSQVNLPRQKPTMLANAPLGSDDTGSRLDSVVARRHLGQGPALSAISTGSSIRLSSTIYPDKPKFADGDSNCACPYCARPLKTNRLKNDPKYWQNHMDEDIEPYVCLSEDCTSPMLFFVHMKDWMSHMVTFHSDEWHRKIHMSTWYCDVDHEAVYQFNDHESFVRHMKDPANHPNGSPPTDLQLDTLSSDNQKILVRDDEYCCPFCECVPDTLEPILASSDPDKIIRSLYEHIACHIKDFSLKAISIQDEVKSSENGQSDIDNGSHERLVPE